MKKIFFSLALFFLLLFEIVPFTQKASAQVCGECAYEEQDVDVGDGVVLGCSNGRRWVQGGGCSGYNPPGNCCDWSVCGSPQRSCSQPSLVGGSGPTSILRIPTGLPVNQPSGTPTSWVGNLVTFSLVFLASLGVIASIIWLLYGGIKYVTAGGDKAAVESARSHIIAAIIGLAFLLFTFVIISLVLSVFGTGPLSQISFTIPSLK